jgi:formylmethanofuran dehydrogenase subunit E
MAVILYKPKIGAVRVHVKNEYLERLIEHGEQFLQRRHEGIVPSDIPSEVIDPIISWIENSKDEEMFEYEMLPDFSYNPLRKSINRRKCDACGEYTVEADGKVVESTFLCKPCYYGANK